MTYSIPLFELNFDHEEEEAVLATLRSRWISMGEKTKLLEQKFAEHVGGGHAIAVSSCTAALHLALRVLDLAAGDEVIVPSLTFAATVNAVRYVGATPVFADIKGIEDLGIDPEDVQRKITGRTRAILPMHYAGFACDMDRLGTMAREHGLFLIEDAAHGPDSDFDGKPLGTLGDIGCFSFFSNKNMTCAEGGLALTSNPTYAERMRLMRSHGMTTLSHDRARGKATAYDIVEQGYNYRLDDIRASIALVQLGKLVSDAKKRRQIREWYLDRLSRIDAVAVPYAHHPHRSSNYIFPVILRTGGSEIRDRVRRDLARQGIQTSVHYPALHRFELFKDVYTPLPNTEFVSDHEITLPMFGTMTLEQVDRVTGALASAVA